MNTNEIELQDSTELGSALAHLNDDTRDNDTRMSNIDMRTRLHYSEIASILAVDTLVAFRFLPSECLMFTRQKKRLAVSKDGKGRDEVVAIVAGKREQEGNKSLMERARGFFGGGQVR